MKLALEIVGIIICFLGLFFVCYGIYAIYPPVAYIALGFFFVESGRNLIMKMKGGE